MARPRRDTPPDRFTTSELATGTGLTHRNVILLEEKGLLPTAEGIDGQGGVRLHSIRGLKFVSTIAALQAAGVELILGARLVRAMTEDLEHAYGFFPANLIDDPKRVNAIEDPDAEGLVGKGHEDREFWWHRYLRKHGVHQREAAHAGDFLLTLADRQFAFTGHLNPGELMKIDPAFRIANWERGAAALVLELHTEAGNVATPEGEANRRRLVEQYRAARLNAVGLIVVNLSLAIRTALDRIADHREGKHAAP